MLKHLVHPVRFAIILLLALTGAVAWGQNDVSVSEVEALRSEARRAYPSGFVDHEPWKETIRHAEMLVNENPNDLEARRLLAEIYSETKWWIRAWNSWNAYNDMGGSWDSQAQQRAEEAALSLAFYANQRGDEEDLVRWMSEAAAVRLN